MIRELRDLTRGRVKLVDQTTALANRIHAVFPSVSFAPSSSINFLSEEWATMELTAEILFVEALDDFGTVEIEEVESV